MRFKIGCHTDGLCDKCKVPETVEHYVTDCPHSNVAIALKLKCIDIKMPCQLKYCLREHALTKIIIENNNRLGL